VLWPSPLNHDAVNRRSSSLVGTSAYSAPAMRYRGSHQPHIYKQVPPPAARSQQPRDAWLQHRARSDGNIFQVPCPHHLPQIGAAALTLMQAIDAPNDGIAYDPSLAAPGGSKVAALRRSQQVAARASAKARASRMP
jgi:hypothetical protein